MAPKSAGSVGSYGKSSEGSSTHGGSETTIGVKGDDVGGDLFSRGDGSRKEALFAGTYLVFAGRILETDWRFLLLSTLFEWAQLLNLIFGPNFFCWDVDWDGNNWWRFYKRLLLSNAAVERGWGMYVGVLLVFIIATALGIVFGVWLNHYMKLRTKIHWKWPLHLLRVNASILRVFDVSMMSLLTVSFTCNNDSGRTMFYFPDKGQYWHRLTTAFLAGMFPLGFACAGIAYWRLRFIWGVAERFKGWTPRTPRREVYRFWDEYEVEMVTRVCRKTVKTEQLDVIPDPYYTSLADKVVQAGLLQFPNSALLNIVYASLQAALLNDPSGGSAQLQKARKCADITWVQRFQVYVREQEKLAQKGKDSDQSVTLDAATWTEFTANYKSVIRTHRNALGTLKAFWRLLLRADVSMVALVRQFLRIPASKDAAERAYKALMERYPNNPRVLRAYSRFLQQVKNDPYSAARFASLANKVEEQQEESWRETVFGQLIDRKYLDDKSTRTMAMMDETLDAVVMINSEGMIQYMNQPALNMFGYRKGEVEGCNVNILMPAPINQQHDCAECFLGVLKPLDDDSRLATVYCHASGTVLCINRGLSNLLAYQNADIIGRNLAELTTTMEKTNQIIADISAGDWGTHDVGRLTFMHKFGEEMSMKVVGRKAGTPRVNCCVLDMSNEGNAFTGLVAVSKVTGRITYANTSFCEFVGVAADQLIKMRLHEIIAEPYAMLHQRWIKGRDVSRAPGLRCRAGRAVDFKHGSTGKVVAAMLEITERATEQGDVFSVKVAPLTDSVDKEWNRISLTVAQDGVIATCVGKLTLFGLEKEVLEGKGLDSLLDMYRKEGEELQATHANLLKALRERPRTLRVAVAPRGKRSVPAVLEAVLPGDGATEGPTIIHLYRADCLEGVIELDAAGKMKKVNEEAALIFGVAASSLVGESVQEVLPKVCPGGRTTELLAMRGQRGGSKQKIGASQGADGVHPDKHALHLSLQAAESTERPGRYLVRIVVPKPISAYSSVNRPGAAAPGLPAASRAGTASGCPFSFGSKAGGSKQASLAATVASRPATRGSACPINLNTEEVLSSLSFPPTSRFALKKTHLEEGARRASAGTDTTALAIALATAVAAAAVAAAVAAADPGSDHPQQGGSEEDAGRDPNTGYNSRGEASVSNLAPVLGSPQDAGSVGAIGATTHDITAAEAGAERASEQPSVDPAADSRQIGPNASRPSTGLDGRGLVFAHRPDGSHSYDQSTAAFRFKQLSTMSPQRQSTASSRARLGSARPQTGSTPVTPAAADPSPALVLQVTAVAEDPQPADALISAGEEQAALVPASDPAAAAVDLPPAAKQVTATDAASPAASQQAGIPLPDQTSPLDSMGGQQQSVEPALLEANAVLDTVAGGPMHSFGAPGPENMPQPEQAAPIEATTVAGCAEAAVQSKPSAGGAGGTEADAIMQGQSVVRSMAASEEEDGEGGAEEEMDPAELAVKMVGVRAWLDASAAALPPEQAAPAGPDGAGAHPAGSAVLELPALAPSKAGLPLMPHEPAGRKLLIAAAGASQQVQPGNRANVESSSMGESDTGSLAASDADGGADTSRLRRFKKAYKLLNSTIARQAIERLRTHLRFVLLFLVCAHVAFFAAALVTVNGSLGFILNIDKAEGSAAAATTAAYDGTMLNVSVFLDVDPYPFSVVTQMTLWDATQRLVNSFKDVAAMTTPQLFNLSTSFSYHFALDNSPEGISAALLKIVDMQAWLAVGKLEQVGQVTWILLGIEAGFVIPLAAIYVSRLLYKVAIERFNRFSIFLFIPRPAVLALARAEIVVDEMDDSDDDDEDMGVAADAAAASGAITTGTSAKVLAQKAAQSRLTITRRSMVWLMLPFAVWLVVVGVLWSMQNYLVSSSVERVTALDLSERQVSRAALMWFFQNSLVNAASSIHTNIDTAETLHYRQKLIDTTKYAQYYYELLLYGEDNSYRQLNHSMNEAKLNFPELEFPGTMFTSVPRNKLLYENQCLRLNQSSCLTKDDIMYWTANMGLNTLMYYSYEQALILAQSPTSSIFVFHPTVFYTIMTTDDGDDVANFGTVRALQGVVLAFIIVGSLAYLYFLAMPFVRLTLLESRKVAEVLSYLPHGVDIASLLESANISSSGPNNSAGKAVKRRTSSQSADVELDD
ncbi:hypothetical protein N2152v2_006709 [Parachlorella kessleri]